MSDIDIGAETQRAVDALVFRLKQRREQEKQGEDAPDDEWFAREFMAALRGQGWRPTPAKATDWREANRPLLSERPMTPKERAEWLEKARANCEAATEKFDTERRRPSGDDP